MDTLETQVAKILIGNFRTTTTYVSVLAEKAPHPDCELYAVAELPLFNPAAEADCERITNALIATLRRAYKRSLNENTFETALGEINEELGKLASFGQTTWIGKLNSIIAVKAGKELYIATTGKVLGLLFRDGEFMDITDSPKSQHPLKTFENFANGKIKENDFIVLSTAELSNYISIDRLQYIISTNALGLAAQEIVKILEDNAGPEVAFGALCLYESRSLTETADETINLKEYAPKTRGLKPILGHITKTAKHIFSTSTLHTLKRGLDKAMRKRPRVSVEKFQELGRKNIHHLKKGTSLLRQHLHPSKFSALSGPKKFFLISATVLLLTAVVAIKVAGSRKETREAAQRFNQAASEIQSTISGAESSLLFKDTLAAQSKLAQAASETKKLPAETDEQKETLDNLNKQILELQHKLEKKTDVEVTNLTNLSAAEHLIVLPNLLATETNGSILSYSITTGSTEDGALKSPHRILLNQFIKNTQAVIYDGQGLRVWNFSRGEAGEPFYQYVPKVNDIGGLGYYATNGRIYLIDKQKSQIINFLVSDSGTISRPIIWNKTPLNLAHAQNMAIDGNIYVFAGGTILKFSQGNPSEFSNPPLTTPLSNKGKIFTTKESSNLFVLDSGNNRIVILNKTGELVQILTNPQFTNLTDFSVDEKNKTIYVLNNGSLLKATY